MTFAPTLTAAEDDDIQYSASSSPVAGASSSRKKAARPHKGKGKQKDPEPATEPRDDQLWVDRYAPTSKASCSSGPTLHAVAY